MTSGGTVRSTFNYTLDTGVEPEIYFYEPPHGVEPRRPGDDLREMTVHNGWARAFLFSLDREGFALRDFRSLFQQWDDDSAIRERFYGEAAEFVRIEVGATRLMILDHTIRAKKTSSSRPMSTPPRSARRSCSCIVTTRRIRVRCAYGSSCRLRPTNSSSAGLRSITFGSP